MGQRSLQKKRKAFCRGKGAGRGGGGELCPGLSWDSPFRTMLLSFSALSGKQVRPRPTVGTHPLSQRLTGYFLPHCTLPIPLLPHLHIGRLVPDRPGEEERRGLSRQVLENVYQLPGKEACANFRGVNTPAMAEFKQTWHHAMRNWKEGT